MSRRKSTPTYAYRRVVPAGQEVSILPNCRSLASLLRQLPDGAEPGTWDDTCAAFRPLARRSV